jgi:hypothetical protein
MAKSKKEKGRERQMRIQREQHRPEQDAGYDDAVRGGPRTETLDLRDTVVNKQEEAPRKDDPFDRAARAAARDVRRREGSSR